MTPKHTNIKSFTVVISSTQDVLSLQPKQQNFEIGFTTPKASFYISIKPAEVASGQSPMLAQDKEQYYVLGDDHVDNGSGLQFLGNGLMVRCSAAHKEIEISSSITGLPPAFKKSSPPYNPA